MFKKKTVFLSLLLSFLLFLFIVNSIYEGAYAFINPFFYIYYDITLILLFSLIGSASAIPVLLSAGVAGVFLMDYAGKNAGGAGFTGYFNHAVFGRFFISVIIIQLLIFIVIPFIFSYLISKKYGVAKSVYFPVSAIFFVSFTLAAVYIFAGKIDIVSSLNYFSGDMSEKLIGIYNKMGMGYFTTPKMKVLISNLMKIIFLLLPSILIIFSWMGVWLSFIFLKRISKKDNIFFNGSKENLLLWRSSDYFLLFLIAGIIISIFSIGIFKYIGYNIILLSSSVYLVQGLTIISFFFNKLNINILLRILGYIIIFVFSNPLIIFIIMTGIFDMWFNFRKIETNKKGVGV